MHGKVDQFVVAESRDQSSCIALFYFKRAVSQNIFNCLFPIVFQHIENLKVTVPFSASRAVAQPQFFLYHGTFPIAVGSLA